jgi:1-pyrroline-5-carboxylate dehydrogenase
MMDAVTAVPTPVNEPVLTYRAGSPERATLEARLKELAGDRLDLTAAIGGRRLLGSG